MASFLCQCTSSLSPPASSEEERTMREKAQPRTIQFYKRRALTTEAPPPREVGTTNHLSYPLPPKFDANDQSVSVAIKSTARKCAPDGNKDDRKSGKFLIFKKRGRDSSEGPSAPPNPRKKRKDVDHSAGNFKGALEEGIWRGRLRPLPHRMAFSDDHTAAPVNLLNPLEENLHSNFPNINQADPQEEVAVKVNHQSLMLNKGEGAEKEILAKENHRQMSTEVSKATEEVSVGEINGSLIAASEEANADIKTHPVPDLNFPYVETELYRIPDLNFPYVETELYRIPDLNLPPQSTDDWIDLPRALIRFFVPDSCTNYG